MGDLTNCSTRKRIIVLLRYLYLNTDEQHPASTYDLLDYLEEQGVGTNRKTLKTDMEFLTGEDSAYDIIEIKSKPNRYFWGSREFELPELKLLVDAVSSSRFITPKKSQQLIEKLNRFLSENQRNELQRHLIFGSRVKALNENIYYIIELINDAISREKMIRFNYFEYNAEKEKVLRGNGELYRLSPYTLFWNDDFYYVIGWSDKHLNISSFRVDRMTNVEIADLPAAKKPMGWDPEDYCQKVFEMYRGELQIVTLECENEVMKYVIDHFGEDVHTRVTDEKHFLATMEVSVSPNFFSWIFRFAGKIRIISPSVVRDEYMKKEQKVLKG